eukprot:gene5573-4207_t
MGASPDAVIVHPVKCDQEYADWMRASLFLAASYRPPSGPPKGGTVTGGRIDPPDLIRLKTSIATSLRNLLDRVAVAPEPVGEGGSYQEAGGGSKSSESGSDISKIDVAEDVAQETGDVAKDSATSSGTRAAIRAANVASRAASSKLSATGVATFGNSATGVATSDNSATWVATLGDSASAGCTSSSSKAEFELASPAGFRSQESTGGLAETPSAHPGPPEIGQGPPGLGQGPPAEGGRTSPTDQRPAQRHEGITINGSYVKLALSSNRPVEVLPKGGGSASAGTGTGKGTATVLVREIVEVKNTVPFGERQRRRGAKGKMLTEVIVSDRGPRDQVSAQWVPQLQLHMLAAGTWSGLIVNR